MDSKTKQLATLAMLTAMAYVVGLYRISFMAAAPFLTYDAKDVIIVIGGLMFGPLAALAMSVTLAFLEMITHSPSGIFGMIMNAIASAAFACPAAYIYSRMRNLKGAVIGIAAGIVIATCTMLLWNYLIIPVFMINVTRAQAASMLLPVILPFNLIKTTLNGALVMMIYKPIVVALQASKLYSPARSGLQTRNKFYIGIMLTAAFIAISLILVMLAMQGVF